MFTVILYNSSGGELDRKTGDSAEEVLELYAIDGCLSGGDTLKIIDLSDTDDEQ